MKVLLVNGSPHKNGSTSVALEEVRKTFEECGIKADIFWVGIKALSGCMGCYKCLESGKCTINDNVNKFLDIAGEYDGFIFGSPVHWAGASGHITSFMDRAFFAGRFDKNDLFYLKPAACVVCARRGGASATFDQLNKYFTLMQMPVISSQYWNMVHGMNAQDVTKDEEGMQTMRTLARNMAYFLECKKAANKCGVQPPKREEIVHTNFIRD